MAAHEEGQIFSKHAWRSRAWGYKHFLITSYPHRALTEYFRGKKKFSYIYTYFPHSSEAARCILSKLSQQAPDKETWAEACAGCLRTLRVQQKHNCRGPILHLESHPPFYIPSTAMRTGLGGRKRLAGPGEAAHLAASRLLWPKQEQFQSDARKSPPSLQRTGKGPQNHCCKARDGIRAF